MKYLLTLALAIMLLCGCGRTLTEESPLPSETQPLSAVEETSEPEACQGALQVQALTLTDAQGLRSFGEHLLLFSGREQTTLTVLSVPELTIQASLSLDFSLSDHDPSLQFHPDGTLSCYDPEARETLVLDGSLQILRSIAAPGDLAGQPLLSDDGKTLYYCTASGVRAWDLDSGIRRRVKEMRSDSQTLTGLLMDGTVLQCQVTEGTSVRTLFLSAQDGRLLQEKKGEVSVVSSDDRYYAAVPAGSVPVSVFGTSGDGPQMLVPADPEAARFFLPDCNGLVAVATQEAQTQLEYYRLDTGARISALTLAGFQSPAALAGIGDSLYILTRDSAKERDILCRWYIEEDSPLSLQDSTCYTEPYYTAEAPDTEGLAQCQRLADQLGEKYGLRILIWKDAAAAAPWDYTFEAEHLVPVLRQELALLDKRLAQYPEELLSQTAAHFTSLNLCLVRSLTAADSGSLTAATGVQFLNGTDAYVVIATGEYAGQALYHELFHVMETHIFSTSTAFDRWEELNPAGFQYDYSYTANAQRDSGVYLFQENRAFVDTYSMSFPKEDRARIMEYAMLPGQEALFRPAIMQAKLAALCTGIREAYGLKQSEETFLWEQYLE